MKIIDGKLVCDAFGIFNKPSAEKKNAIEFNNFTSKALAKKRVMSLVGTKNLKETPVSGGTKVSGNGVTMYIMEVK